MAHVEELKRLIFKSSRCYARRDIDENLFRPQDSSALYYCPIWTKLTEVVEHGVGMPPVVFESPPAVLGAFGFEKLFRLPESSAFCYCPTWAQLPVVLEHRKGVPRVVCKSPRWNARRDKTKSFLSSRVNCRGEGTLSFKLSALNFYRSQLNSYCV
jgi:hypothetical protein